MKRSKDDRKFYREKIDFLQQNCGSFGIIVDYDEKKYFEISANCDKNRNKFADFTKWKN